MCQLKKEKLFKIKELFFFVLLKKYGKIKKLKISY